MSISREMTIDVNSASYYALHVALQTLKERCKSMQQRLTVIEDENGILRKSQGLDRPPPSDSDVNNTEEHLRGLVSDLVRKNSQLTAHINMLETENRQIWARLSKLTKENSNLGLSITKIKDVINNGGTSPQAAKNGHLIRSKTFTQHSPNPKFRDKCVVEDDNNSTATTTNSDGQTDKMSLEEISLELINKLVEGKKTFEQNCGEMLETNSTGHLCFGNFNDSTVGTPSSSGVAVPEIERSRDNVKTVNDSLVQQQDHLKRLISSISKMKDPPPICNECTRKTSDKIEMTTDYAAPTATAADDTTQNRPNSDQVPVGLNAPAIERTCPMCGKIYGHLEDFELFQRHVELHFIDDNESLDLSLDKNYDMISHTMGDF